MKSYVLVLICCVTMTGLLAGQHGKSPAVLFKGCTGCHGTPDASLRGDALWIKRTATTACVQPPAPRAQKLRAGLMSWLESPDVDRPRIERAPRKPKRGEGIVSFCIGPGSLLLVPAEAGSLRPVRLLWSDGGVKRAERAVPAGRYLVRNYRMFRKDAAANDWQAWASGTGRSVTVKAGAMLSLAIDPKVHVKAGARPRRGLLSVGVAVTGDHGMGLTVIRKGDRVPARYAIRGGGRDIASGALDYG